MCALPAQTLELLICGGGGGGARATETICWTVGYSMQADPTRTMALSAFTQNYNVWIAAQFQWALKKNLIAEGTFSLFLTLWFIYSASLNSYKKIVLLYIECIEEWPCGHLSEVPGWDDVGVPYCVILCCFSNRKAVTLHIWPSDKHDRWNTLFAFV